MSSAADRAKQTAAEHKARRAARQPEEEEVTYPHLEEFRIASCVILDRCPTCGEVTGIDYGGMLAEEIPVRTEFECESCETKWAQPFNLTNLLGNRRPWRWEEDAYDHWTAELPGGHALVVWGMPGGTDWTWEVWPEDRPNPDEPDFVGEETNFEEACAAAERCAEEQGLITAKE